MKTGNWAGWQALFCPFLVHMCLLLAVFPFYRPHPGTRSTLAPQKMERFFLSVTSLNPTPQSSFGGVVQLFSHVTLFATLWNIAHQASLSFSISWSLLKLMPIELVMLPNFLILCCPLLLLPLIFPASGSFPMKWLFTSGGQGTGASASASVPPINIQGWFPLGLTYLINLLSQGILKSLLQHHNSKASVLQCSALFMVQLSHRYMTTGKTIALTKWTFVGKVI